MTLAHSLLGFIEGARTRVDEALARYLPSSPACPPIISDAMRYSVFAGGKRLRPILALAAAEATAPAGGADAAATLALPAACALELLHTYSLIHDDLPSMDNDTLRRGRPTLHVVYGDGIAILAGDALQAEAFSLLSREPASDDPAIAVRKLRTIQLIADAAGASGMVGGQAIDLQAAGQAPGHGLTLTSEALQGMHLRKTGAIIRAAAVSGAIMAGGDAPIVNAVGRWAAEIGLAFQIVDDILDVEGDAVALGKTAGKDAASDKPTYPSLFGLDRSKALAAACAERAQGILEDANLTHGRLEEIAEWIIARKN